MPLSTRYPEIIQLEDGTRIQLTKDSWKTRQLVVVYDGTEDEIRDAFASEGFDDAVLEVRKTGQLGHGMIKQNSDWQIHIRLFPHGECIELDGEKEVSSRYVEHVNHGWIPAIEECVEILSRYAGGARLYHKGLKQYVQRIISTSVVPLPDPATKTQVTSVVTGLLLLAGALLGWRAYKALRQA